MREYKKFRLLFSFDGRQSKLRILADAAKYDASCASSGSTGSGLRAGSETDRRRHLPQLYARWSLCIPPKNSPNELLYLRLLLLRKSRLERHTTRPIHTAGSRDVNVEFYKRNYIEGLFPKFRSHPKHRLHDGGVDTSSAFAPKRPSIRRLYPPEGSPWRVSRIIVRAGQWADRLSANIELPTQADLDRLAPAKSHEEIETSMSQIHAGIARRKNRDIAMLEARARRWLSARLRQPMQLSCTASHLYTTWV